MNAFPLDLFSYKYENKEPDTYEILPYCLTKTYLFFMFAAKKQKAV